MWKRPALFKSALGISTRTMHQSTTPSLSQTIWPRWASRQFGTVPIFQTCDFWLFPKFRGCRYETIEEMKVAVTKVMDTLTQEDFYGVFQKLLERYKCIAAGGDYFEGDLSIMCVLSIKVPIRKNSRNLSYAPRIYIYIYIYIYIIMSCHQHGYPWPSLATSLYHSSPPAGLQGYILCPHIADVCKFELVVLLLLGHMWGSIGVHQLRARPCFSSSVLLVWFV